MLTIPFSIRGCVTRIPTGGLKGSAIGNTENVEVMASINTEGGVGTVTKNKATEH